MHTSDSHRLASNVKPFVLVLVPLVVAFVGLIAATALADLSPLARAAWIAVGGAAVLQGASAWARKVEARRPRASRESHDSEEEVESKSVRTLDDAHVAIALLNDRLAQSDAALREWRVRVDLEQESVSAQVKGLQVKLEEVERRLAGSNAEGAAEMGRIQSQMPEQLAATAEELRSAGVMKIAGGAYVIRKGAGVSVAVPSVGGTGDFRHSIPLNPIVDVWPLAHSLVAVARSSAGHSIRLADSAREILQRDFLSKLPATTHIRALKAVVTQLSRVQNRPLYSNHLVDDDSVVLAVAALLQRHWERAAAPTLSDEGDDDEGQLAR